MVIASGVSQWLDEFRHLALRELAQSTHLQSSDREGPYGGSDNPQGRMSNGGRHFPDLSVSSFRER